MNFNLIPPQDRKGIAFFLAMTFGFTYTIIFMLWLKGFSLAGRYPLYANMPLAFMMFIPAVSAYIAKEYVTRQDLGDTGLAVGPWKYYIQSYLLMPLIFLVIYTLTAIFISRPDFSYLVSVPGYTENTDEKFLVTAAVAKIVTGIVFTSLFTGPLISSLHAFGQEFGWRGYFLQKLLPLGKTRAIIISSLAWALWYAPFVLIGMHIYENQVLGALTFFLLISLVGIYIGYLRMVSGSVLAAAFAHGVFNVQLYGPWYEFFPTVNHYFGGILGLAGIAIFLAIAAWLLVKKIPNATIPEPRTLDSI